MANEIDLLHERAHIIEGLLRVLDAGPTLLAEIGACADRQEARDMAMRRWRLSGLQARHVLDLPFGRATRLGRDDLKNELVAVKEAIDNSMAG